MTNLVNDLESNKEQQTILLSNCKRELIDSGMTEITKFFPKSVLDEVVAETERLFRRGAERRDFIDENNSPRNLYNIREETISIESKILKEFYYSLDIIELLQLITGENIDFVPFSGERYIINGLVKENDSQGWHRDDYSYAMVCIAKAAKKECGGLLEYIPHIYWDREYPNIQQILEREVIYKKWFAKGSVYLMRSDNTLHRVSNITKGERIAFVTAYSNEADLLKKLDHRNTLLLAGINDAT